VAAGRATLSRTYSNSLDSYLPTVADGRRNLAIALQSRFGNEPRSSTRILQRQEIDSGRGRLNYSVRVFVIGSVHTLWLAARFLLKRGPHMATVEEHIQQASAFGQRLEDIIVRKGSFTLSEAPDREKLLIAYWALTLDLDKSILALMRNKFYGGAFALLRPIVEAEVRAHVALMASEEIVASIKDDTYKTNFKKVGGEIDAAFGLEGFFDRYLNGAKGALHSFTHSGLSQLVRRFN
jgi:hypothetical protein